MGTDQGVIDTLTLIKEAICGTGDPLAGGLVQITGTTTGELTRAEQDAAEPLLTDARTKINTLINASLPPNYDPSTAGSTYTAPDTSGTTDVLIGDACQEACDSLDDYIACNDDDSGQHARRTLDLLDAFETSAGMA